MGGLLVHPPHTRHEWWVQHAPPRYKLPFWACLRYSLIHTPQNWSCTQNPLSCEQKYSADRDYILQYSKSLDYSPSQKGLAEVASLDSSMCSIICVGRSTLGYISRMTVYLRWIALMTRHLWQFHNSPDRENLIQSLI